MIYIIWLVLFSLIVFSLLRPEFPIWAPIAAYILVVGVRIKQKIGDYNDSKKENERNKERAIDENLHNFEIRGMASSGRRMKYENFIKEDFKFKRKKRRRQFETEIIDCLFLRK